MRVGRDAAEERYSGRMKKRDDSLFKEYGE